MSQNSALLDPWGANRLRALLAPTGALPEALLAQAERLADERGERIIRVLTRAGLVAEPKLAALLAKALGLPPAQPAVLAAASTPPAEISQRFLREADMLPLAAHPDRLVLALSDPLDDAAIEAVRLAAGRPLDLHIACAADIDAAWSRLAGSPPAAAVTVAPHNSLAHERLADLSSDAPVIRLVNQLIATAVDQGASDIHLEPMDHRLRIRTRIDGLLHEQPDAPAPHAEAMVSRLKVMARLNIAEHRIAQDGRIRMVVRGREIDLRVATMPGLHGEAVVLRILNQQLVALDFAAMGFTPDHIATIGGLLTRSRGILLVTGPTGSGKTTTLYAALDQLNHPSRKILTVEDPIEYHLPGIHQLQIHPQIGLDFAAALRAFLRQDPDVMMVGEIRDRDTADIAVRAALTGHLILSTLHTNSAAAAVTRLRDMGIAPPLIAETVGAVIAQRLLRRLCPHCHGDLLRAPACPGCEGRRYRGRTAIVEILPFTDAIRRQIIEGADSARIEATAAAEGMLTMHQHGLARISTGDTTAEELYRVTQSG